MAVLILLAATAALVRGDAFLEDGKEYVFEELGSQTAGTMDYAPHATGMAWKAKVRMQVHGPQINVKMTEFKTSMYNGEYHPTSDAWGRKTQFQPYTLPNNQQAIDFNIKYDHGRVVSLVMPPNLHRAERNMIKAWVSNWQIALHDQHGGHGDHHHAFASEEKLLHGDCEIHYTKSDNMITRAVSHMADCKNRKYRILNNWRGHRCDGEPPMHAFDDSQGQMHHGMKNPEPTWSNADNFYVVEMKGERYKVLKLSSNMIVNVQKFESAGVSHTVFYNRTMTLLEEKNSAGDLSVRGTEYTDLGFEFADDQYKWNDDINLEDMEPFFSSEIDIETDQNKLKVGLKRLLGGMYDNFERHDNSEDTVNKMHESGVTQALKFLVSMNFQTLNGLFEELKRDQSEKGLTVKNLFTEYLGSTGTRASAMMVKHAVEQKLFANDPDAARALTSVAFHIRRPNKNLVNTFNNLNTGYAQDKFTQMALPLARAHLARRTCELAIASEREQCIREVSDPLAQQAFSTYTSSNSYEIKSLQLTFMHNLRLGKVAELLKPIVYGEIESDDSMRARAIRATGWKVLKDGEGSSWYLPVFINRGNGHETRIEALKMIFHAHPDATTLSTIVSSLYGEPDFEVVNFAFALFEKYAKSINPCNRSQAHQGLAKYFIKYMKQAGLHHTSYGFGISKATTMEFQKEKYGYGGAYEFYTTGSHKSTTPLTLEMTISNNLFHGYENNIFTVHLRIEGLAKALVRKFTKVRENIWKLQDLKTLLEGMGLLMKANQKVRVEVLMLVKGTVVWDRLYDENAMKKGGKIAQFLESFTEIGKKKQYSINHQRVLVFGEAIYEQPTDSGLPMSYLSYLTTMASIKADVGSGTKRGSIEREINYDLNLFTQYADMLVFGNPETSHTFWMTQDRVYGAHHPRKISLSINLVGKDKNVNLKVSRPEFAKPLAWLMHSKTDLFIIHKATWGAPTGLQLFCPTCLDVVRLSKGNQAKKTKVVSDNYNKNTGSYAHGEIFGCEMEVNEKNALGNIVGNFMPFDKSPKDPLTSFLMGVRELQAFFLYFPRPEQCGAYFRWSQSELHPVKELQFKVQAKVTSKGQPVMFREGQLVMLKVTITAVSGESKSRDRQYKVNFKYVSEAGNLDNSITVAIIRNSNQHLGITGYKICAGYNSKYSDWGDEMIAVDPNQNLQVNGKANLNYGSGKGSCDILQSKIAVDFLHTTTDRARQEIQNTWYYKVCEEDKMKPEWVQRVAKGAAPFTEACIKTNFDLAQARHYKWNAQMVGLTPKVKGVIAKAQSIVKAGSIPYWDLDPAALKGAIGDSPTLDLEVDFHDNEKLMDIELKTVHGTTTWPSIPVVGSVQYMTQSLRSLRFERSLSSLIQANIVNPCVLTTKTILINDNMTYPYTPESCWTLASSHCSEKPSYAVFTKKNGNGLDLEAYIGGHKVEISTAGQVTVDGANTALTNKKEKIHKEGGEEIFKLLKWGSTYTVYSKWKVMIIFDGTFVEVVPFPSVKGQHCGVCGNYDNNMNNDLIGKDGNAVAVEDLAKEWCR